jgi:hypothetical protein
MVKHITIFLLALIVHTQIFVALGHAQNFLDMYGNSKVYPLLWGWKKTNVQFWENFLRHLLVPFDHSQLSLKE